MLKPRFVALRVEKEVFGARIEAFIADRWESER